MPSRTVVFQMYRTQNVPAWIARCMETTFNWAKLREFDYKFVDDKYLDGLPAEYRARVNNRIVLSDYARLLLSRDFLSQGYERAVWVDADLVVWDPQSWVLPTDSKFYFCHELWPTPAQNGVRFDIRATNCVTVFSQGNHFLDFYIDTCKRILASNDPLKNWHLGVRFLTGLRNVSPLPLLNNIAMLGANLIEDLVRGPKLLANAYVRAMGVPLVAANCCASIQDTTSGTFQLTEKVFEQIIEQCISSRGEILNGYLRV